MFEFLKEVFHLVLHATIYGRGMIIFGFSPAVNGQQKGFSSLNLKTFSEVGPRKRG
ncbi:MAG: hypothetical protein CM15mP22_6830 [Gammaproteobacteria bacterium]|nr:MAG: hypothetical protein CM15mP22_6830 [Gammaproteobacteria bacterium]